MKRALCVAALLVACGGTAAAPSSAAESARPVRVDDPEGTSASTSAATSPRPVRVAPVVPGEAAESEDLAAPPPVEAPTGP